jgi:hypothetical protein
VVILGVRVVIRTFLSWALVVEIEGRWPWVSHEGREEPEAWSPRARIGWRD